MEYTSEFLTKCINKLRSEKVITKQNYKSLLGSIESDLGIVNATNFIKRRGFDGILDSRSPYLQERKIVITYKYNPDYGDHRICKCGHEYHRHFDSYENMEKCGCKYCSCFEFEEDLCVGTKQE